MKTLVLFVLASGCLFAQAPTLSWTATPLQDGQTVTINCTSNCTSLVWKVNGIAGGNSTVGTISGNNSSATYTAPSSIVSNNSANGCPVGLNDAIWNVPVSSVPAMTAWRGDSFLNSAWMINYAVSGFGGSKDVISGSPGMSDSFHIGFANSSAPVVTMTGVASMPWPQAPSRGRESGLYNWNLTDQHGEIINTDTCDLWDLYGENINTYTSGCTGGQTCYTASGAAAQSANSYSRNGGVNAGGNMVLPYLLHLSEIHNGVIKHQIQMNIAEGTAGNQNNIMWPATYSTGWCSGNEIVGLSGFPTGSGYSAATTISFSGGGGAGTVWTPVITGGVITGATLTHGETTPWTSVPTVIVSDTGGGTGASLTANIDIPCYPYGSRIALDQTYLAQHAGASCSAGTKCLTGAGLIVATALANYGGIPLDNQDSSGGWIIDAADDLLQDPGVRSSITSALNTLTFSDFDIYDNTNLGESTADNIHHATGCTDNESGQPCSNVQVAPDNNAGIIPPGAAWVSATNGSGTSHSLAMLLQPSTIGTTEASYYVLAGDYSGSKGASGGWQIPYWVRGNSNTTVNWSCSTCSANGSAVTTSGIYTPPLTLSTVGLVDTVVGTLAADSNVTVTLYIYLLPNSGNYVPSTIRADVGTASNIEDGNGHYWLGNIGYRGGQPVNLNNTWSHYSGTGEQAIYNTSTWWQSDATYKFIVPNGNYSVRVMTGWDGGASQSISNKGWNHTPYMIWSNDDGYTGTSGGYSNIKGLLWNPMEHSPHPYALDSNSDFIFGDHVVDNTLVVGVGGADLNSGLSPNQGFTACVAVNGAGTSCFPWPSLSGIDIEPDASSPHWTIGCTNGISPTYPNTTTFLTDASQVAAGGQIGLYVHDFYTGTTGQLTGIPDPTWTIVSGPGTLSASTIALAAGLNFPIELYSAPSNMIGNQRVIIQAQSISQPSIKATIALDVIGQQTGPTASAVSFH